MKFDYHRKRATASELYKELENLPKSDLFIIWDLSTSKNPTEAEKEKLNYLIKIKYDLTKDLESNELSPFVEKYLLIKFGAKEKL